MKKTLVSAKELAVYLAVHVKTVLKWARAGIIPVIRLSKRCVRFDLEQCVRIIRGLTSGPT
jgi:excisionase family DNA binding protein